MKDHDENGPYEQYLIASAQLRQTLEDYRGADLAASIRGQLERIRTEVRQDVERTYTRAACEFAALDTMLRKHSRPPRA